MEKPRIIRIIFSTIAWALICISYMIVIHNFINVPEDVNFSLFDFNICFHKLNIFNIAGISVVVFAVCETIHTTFIAINVNRYYKGYSEKSAIVTHILIGIFESLIAYYSTLVCILSIYQLSIRSITGLIFIALPIALSIIFLLVLTGVLVSGKYSHNKY